MATDGVDFQALKAAIAAVLEPVEGVHKVETKRGGVYTWVERQAALQTFWEVEMVSVTEGRNDGSTGNSGASFGPGPAANQFIDFELHGFTPYQHSNPDTTVFWDDLLRRVGNQLRNYPTLANAVPGIKGADMPQLVRNERVDIPDGQGQTGCHHVLFALRYTRWMTWTPTATL